MSYHADPVVNDMLLTIINDGDGKLCGRSYRQRLAAAAHGNMLFEFRYMCREYGRVRARAGASRPTREQTLLAASLLQAYYEESVEELTPEERAKYARDIWQRPAAPRCYHCGRTL